MSDPTLVRRLTTIVAIDVVAFSTMSARDEEHALALLGARMDIAGAMIRHHRGRVFKLTGDGLLAEFASPVEAVRAALEIQEAMRSANVTSSDDDQLNLRIGVNLGDIVESGDDLMGDAVNVAVRLESIATTGGICVSSSVYDQIVGKLMLGVEDIGEQHVKNIPRPIHAYRLTANGAPPTASHPAHQVAKASPQSRMVLASAIVAALVAAGVGGTVYLHQGPRYGLVQIAEPTSASPAVPPTTPAAPATPLSSTPRPFEPKEVPFVPDFRWRALEHYASAGASKALALNVRGIFALAARRIDDAAARDAALEECNRLVEENVPVVRVYDRCMLYAVGNRVVWSFRPPPMPPLPYVPAARPKPPISFDPATAPLLNPAARQRLAEHYLKSEHNRAFVLGHNHVDWWTPSETDKDAIRRNLQSCGHLTGRPCVVYALNNEVLVRTPETMRVVNVFAPQDLPGLDTGKQQALERYLIADDWRAVALSTNGRIGIVSGRPSERDATDEAKRACARAGGMDCTVTAIGPFLVAPNQ
jgi:class 3 adenylate cyclase